MYMMYGKGLFNNNASETWKINMMIYFWQRCFVGDGEDNDGLWLHLGAPDQ